MAFAYFKLAPRRRSFSQSAAQAISYLLRRGQSRFTARADDLRHVEIFRLPAWAGSLENKVEPQGEYTPLYQFFWASEQYERSNGTWALSMKCALPREVEAQEHLRMAREFIAQACQDKAGFWVLHDQTASDGKPNVHIHVLVSGRRLDGQAHTPQTFFADPRSGGQAKDQRLMKREAAWQLHCLWVDITNAAYRRAGLDLQLTYAWSYRQQLREIDQRLQAIDQETLGLELDRVDLQLDAMQRQGPTKKRGIARGRIERRLDLGIE